MPGPAASPPQQVVLVDGAGNPIDMVTLVATQTLILAELVKIRTLLAQQQGQLVLTSQDIGAAA